jgi:sugar phosphate isomerase/epimerase
LGVCSSAFGHRQALTRGKLRQLVATGVAWIEISALQTQHLNLFDQERVEELVQAAAEFALRVWSLHAPFCGLAMDDADTRADGLRHLLQAARVAARFGAVRLVVHPGRDVPSVDRRRELTWMSEGLARALDSLPPKIVLAVETMGPKSLAGPAEEMLRVLDGLDPLRVGIGFDTGHVHTGGDPADYARTVAGRISSVHLHDNFGDQDAHALPGEGNIDWPSCLRALREAGYDGVWLSEGTMEGLSGDAVAREYIRRMQQIMGA